MIQLVPTTAVSDRAHASIFVWKIYAKKMDPQVKPAGARGKWTHVDSKRPGTVIAQ